MSGIRSYVVSLAFGLGMAGVFLGERVLAAGTGRTVLTALGVLLVLLALGLRALRMGKSQQDARRIEKLVFGLYLLGVAGLLLYFGQSDLMDRLAGKSFADEMPRLAGVLAALWPVVVATSVLPVLLVEFSYASMARAPVVEHGRVADAALSGLGLAWTLVFAFAAVYVATQRDVKWDLSYFRTAKPGEATRKIVRGLDQPVEVALFFPPANEVQQAVMEYFTDLAQESKQIKVANLDQAVDLARARELGVSGNGAIVVARGGRKEQFLVGQKIELARPQLRELDKEIQKRLLQVSRPQRVVYLTAGHGERSDGQALPGDQRATIAKLKELLRTQNYEVRTYGAAEGLASELPRDAAAVLILGPTSDFLPQETAAVLRYLKEGGRALVALDPEAGLTFKELLEPLGLSYSTTTLANDMAHFQLRGQPSDRIALGTASYSAHPAVTSLSQLGPRALVVLIGAGALSPSLQRPAGSSLDFTVHAHPATWADLDGNFEFNPPQEVRKAYELAAAITLGPSGPEGKGERGRVLVFADSDALADSVLDKVANPILALDGVRWLLGDEAIAGSTSSEADVPIEHTRKQDVFWFYSTIFLVPALVLGVGLVLTRRGGKGKKAAVKSKEAP